MTKLKDYPSGTVEAGVKLAGVNGVGDVQLYDATTFVGPVGPESQVPGPQGAVGPALTPNEHAVFNEAKVTSIQTADIDWVIVVDNDTRSNQASPASIAGDMSGHMLKFRTSDNTWLDLGQWRGPQGIEGPPGPAGGGGLGAKPINEVSVYQTDFGFTGAIGTLLAGFGFSATVAGTAAAATATMSGGTGRSGSGKVQLKPGSTSSGTSKVTHGNATYPYKPGEAAHVAIAGACIPTLSDSSQRIRAFVGCSAAPQSPSGTTYSVGFQYSDDVNGGRWQIIVRDSTGENLHDTGVTVVALAWYHMEIHFNTVGDQVSLVLGGTTFGPYTYTGTAIHGIGAGVAKLLGTIERTLEIDYLSHTVSWVGNRI